MNKLTSKKYRTPLDVTNLLYSEEDLISFFNYLAKHYIDKCESLMMEDDEYLFPIILHNSFGIYNIEYNYLIEVMSDWIGGESGQLFKQDFLLTRSDKENGHHKFFIIGLLEFFWKISRVNNYRVAPGYKKEHKFSLNFYRNIIYTNGDKAVQHNSTAFVHSKISQFIDEDLFSKMNIYALDESIVQSAFGSTKCTKWWKEKNMKPILYE